MGNSDYWMWLINVLIEQGYCTGDMVEYLIWRVVGRKGRCLENGLEGLLRLVKKKK